jgi:alpha-galactosidase
VYRLIDELRRRHPRLEIESCSAGGARADLEILERTDRIWASDCIDALERQQIERWTGLLLPPELIGSHVGAPRSHSTGRTHDLPFRAGTALFGHFGIEWDLRLVPPDERAQLARWVALYKEHRDLLHHGHVVRIDHADPSMHVHGVVAQNRSQAIYAIVALATSVWTPPGRVLLPGLDPDALYRLRPLTDEIPAFGPDRMTPWWQAGATLPGKVLSHVGVQIPAQLPEHLLLLRAERV